MKIGIYFDNRAIAEVDLSHPENGNPGIGATEYLLASLPHYLSKHSRESIQSVFYAREPGELPRAASVTLVSGPAAGAEAARRDSCDVFLCLPPFDDIDMAVFAAVGRLTLPTVMWANLTPSARCLREIHECRYVRRLVCAGLEGLDFLRDHPAFSKATFIFNAVDVDLYAPPPKVAKAPNTAVYLGSLVPAKGFHLLARVWPSVRKKVPGAKLLVIGTGDLYRRGVPLGRWGIAEENYESKIRACVSGPDGSPGYGVKFLGRLGAEKIPLLQSACIGIVNPSGRSEICPVSALELQASGTAVVSTPKHGVVDTVISGQTGLLGRGERALRNNITHLLRRSDVAERYGANALRLVRETFSYDVVVPKWHKLLRAVVDNQPPDYHPARHLLRNAKFLREASRLARGRLSLPLPSTVEIRDVLKNRLS